VTGQNIGVRLVKDVSIRSILAHAPQKLEVGRETAATQLNRPIIFDLTGDEDMATLASRPTNCVRAAIVLSDASFDDQTPKLTRSFKRSVVEVSLLEQQLAGHDVVLIAPGESKVDVPLLPIVPRPVTLDLPLAQRDALAKHCA